jgi:hypothetical protein
MDKEDQSLFAIDKISAAILEHPQQSSCSLHQNNQLEFSFHCMQEMAQASYAHGSPDMGALCWCCWFHVNLASVRTAE